MTVAEGRTELIAWRNLPKEVLFHHVTDVHCDSDVKITSEKLEIVSGGCPKPTGFEWWQAAYTDREPQQHLFFDFDGASIKPNARFLGDARTLESEDEETLRKGDGVAGVLQARAYAASGIILFRKTVRLRLTGGGCIPASNEFQLDVPAEATVVEIQGWTPALSGRFDLSEFPASP